MKKTPSYNSSSANQEPIIQANSAIAIARRLSYSLFATNSASSSLNGIELESITDVAPNSTQMRQITPAHVRPPIPISDALDETINNPISQDENPSLIIPHQLPSIGEFLEEDNVNSSPSTDEKRKPIPLENEGGIEIIEATVNNQVVSISPTESDNISEELALFLKQMAIHPNRLEASEIEMLEAILAPKTWKQKLPTYLRLPAASELITNILFYLAIHKDDLASPNTSSNKSTQFIHLKGKAIPLFNEQAITRAYRIIGFSNTVSWVGSMWLLLYLSLQINAFILKMQNGESNYKPSDILFEPYNLYQIFTDTGQSTKASLVNSLSNYVVWPLLLGTPFLGGAFTSWRYGRMAQNKNEATTQADLTVLQNYTPSIWLDYIRWYIPNHPLSGPLNRLRMNMLFNANESINKRNQSVEVLTQLLEKAKGHTQVNVRDVLAALTFSISIKDLIKVKEIFPESDHTHIIKTIGKAYSNLTGTALSLQPQKNENHLDAFLRGIKTRYLNHHQQLGHSGKLLLLFILYDFYISYGDTSLVLIVLKGMIKAFNNLDEMIKCKKDNKIWTWRKESKTYICSVCGDEDQIAYRDIWTQESCVTAFLSRPQAAEKIVNFFSSHHLQDITAIDFSAQINAGWTAYHTTEELDIIFEALNKHLPNIYNFTFRSNDNGAMLDVYPDSSYAGAPLGRFFKNAKNLKIADLSALFLQANGTADLARVMLESGVWKNKLGGVSC